MEVQPRFAVLQSAIGVVAKQNATKMAILAGMKRNSLDKAMRGDVTASSHTVSIDSTNQTKNEKHSNSHNESRRAQVEGGTPRITTTTASPTVSMLSSCSSSSSSSSSSCRFGFVIGAESQR
uniref:50S ribosomal protein L30 n=1 Tax=Lygus hesperus TaxID=30085 RepID=A0A0A9X9H7_LYGHE